MSGFNNQWEELKTGALTIPNLMSAARIIMVPIFLVLMLQGHYAGAIVVLILSALSDFFDGKVARRFNQVSNLGKILDPVADKLTEICISIAYFFIFHGMDDPKLRAVSYLFWLFVVKEAIMVIGGLLLLSRDETPQAAAIYGKVATFFYYLFMTIILLFAPQFGALHHVFTLPSMVIVILVICSAILSIIALLSYAPRAIRQFLGKEVH
ncbi:MAG: CDP-alcohol phosphatidyltransferase family protein [Clostridia bacterium]|nr:CDP-alcohol phosphatidyltransferase family protein [Clostridia bacterium]